MRPPATFTAPAIALALALGGCGGSGGGDSGSTTPSKPPQQGAGGRTGVVKANQFGVLSARHGIVYGQLGDAGPAIRLGGQTGGYSIPARAWPAIRLERRFAAYETISSTGIARVNVFDLRDGRLMASAPAHTGAGRSQITSLSLKRNGSVAWIARGRPRYEVHELQVRSGRDQLLDSGANIGPTSLGVSFYELDIFWTDRGRPRSAPFA